MNQEFIGNITHNRTKMENDKQDDNEVASRSGSSSRSGSPSRDVVGVDNTKPTERQWPESKLLSKVEEISIVHSVWMNLLARYTMIKGKHPIVKEVLELGEDAAYWTEQKAESLATATRVDRALKKIDSVAFNGVVKIEDTQTNLRNRFDSANKEVRVKITSANKEVRLIITNTSNKVQTRITNTSNKVHKRTEWVRSKAFGPIHTLLDLVEDKFEVVMLKPSAEEEKKASEDPEVMKTVGRLVDVTYRFNLGMVHFSAQKAKDTKDYLTDRKTWENFYVSNVQPHTPGKVRIRQSIIFQEILKELRRDPTAEDDGNALNYLENKELIVIDRKIIDLLRALVSRSKNVKNGIVSTSQNVKNSIVSTSQNVKDGIVSTTQNVKKGITEAPSKIWDTATRSLTYSKDALGHLGEARSLRDLAGIGMYEVRGVLMGAQSSLDVLRKSALLDGTISWMASQEKILSNTL